MVEYINLYPRITNQAVMVEYYTLVRIMNSYRQRGKYGNRVTGIIDSKVEYQDTTRGMDTYKQRGAYGNRITGSIDDKIAS